MSAKIFASYLLINIYFLSTVKRDSNSNYFENAVPKKGKGGDCAQNV